MALLGYGLFGLGRGHAHSRMVVDEVGSGGHASIMTRVAHILPWVFLGVGLLVATAPAWRFAVTGFNPTLDQALAILCRPR
jgi:hypothetical protein